MIIERYFFIIRQPFAGSPSFEEVEVCVPTILPGGIALVLGLVGLIAAVGYESALIAGLIGYNLLNKEK